MLSRDVVAIFMEQVPDEVRALRDSIAKAEADHTGLMWERHRELHGRIKELKDRCEQAGHSLVVVRAGEVGTRRKLLRNRRDERRTCIMCGTEEVGKVATGAFSRFLFRRAHWKFERMNGYISRTFTDHQWYLETLSLIRNFSFSTDVILQHAFPPQLPSSYS
jgi:hypothetical protein